MVDDNEDVKHNVNTISNISGSATTTESDFDVDVDYSTLLPEALYKRIERREWDVAMERLRECPEEAGRWVCRRGRKGDVRWRALPLHQACARDPPRELVDALLSSCPASASAGKGEGNLPLHYAVQWGLTDVSILDLLVEACPDGLDVKDTRGLTPLRILEKGRLENRDELLERLRLYTNNIRSSSSSSSSSGEAPLTTSESQSLEKPQTMERTVSTEPTPRTTNQKRVEGGTEAEINAVVNIKVEPKIVTGVNSGILTGNSNETIDQPQASERSQKMCVWWQSPLLSFRFSNRIVGAVWSRSHVASLHVHVHIFFPHTNTYDLFGPVASSSFLRALALVAMDPPFPFHSSSAAIEEVTKILRACTIVNAFLGTNVNDEEDEDDVANNPKPSVTYAALLLNLPNVRWDGVPVVLEVTGESSQGGDDENNTLSAALQSNELDHGEVKCTGGAVLTFLDAPGMSYSSSVESARGLDDDEQSDNGNEDHERLTVRWDDSSFRTSVKWKGESVSSETITNRNSASNGHGDDVLEQALDVDTEVRKRILAPLWDRLRDRRGTVPYGVERNSEDGIASGSRRCSWRQVPESPDGADEWIFDSLLTPQNVRR